MQPHETTGRHIASLLLFALAACKAETPQEPATSNGSEDAAGKTLDAAVTPPDNQPDAAAAPDASVKRDTKSKVERPPPPDAFFGESRCPDGVLFCEDFDGNALDPAKWTTRLGGATLTFDGTELARGAGSMNMKLTSQVGSGATIAWADTLKTFPMAAGGGLWVRAFYRIDAGMPNRWFPIFRAVDSGGQERLLALIPASETLPSLWAVFYWVASEGMNIASQSVHAPLDTWACFEMEFRGGDLHFYLNGDEVTEMTAKGWPALKEAKLSFGVQLTHDDIFKHPNGFNVRVDAIAVSAARVGCTM